MEPKEIGRECRNIEKCSDVIENTTLHQYFQVQRLYGYESCRTAAQVVRLG